MDQNRGSKWQVTAGVVKNKQKTENMIHAQSSHRNAILGCKLYERYD